MGQFECRPAISREPGQGRLRSRSAAVAVPGQQRVQEIGPISKIGCLEPFHSIYDVDQLAAACKVEDADRADDREPLRAGDRSIWPMSTRSCSGPVSATAPRTLTGRAGPGFAVRNPELRVILEDGASLEEAVELRLFEF
jgi:hypothetical protein